MILHSKESQLSLKAQFQQEDLISAYLWRGPQQLTGDNSYLFPKISADVKPETSRAYFWEKSYLGE